MLGVCDIFNVIYIIFYRLRKLLISPDTHIGALTTSVFIQHPAHTATDFHSAKTGAVPNTMLTVWENSHALSPAQRISVNVVSEWKIINEWCVIKLLENALTTMIFIYRTRRYYCFRPNHQRETWRQALWNPRGFGKETSSIRMHDSKSPCSLP